MAFYKKSKLHTGTALICSLAIVFSALPVYATDTIDNLQNQTSALENELKGRGLVLQIVYRVCSIPLPLRTN